MYEPTEQDIEFLNLLDGGYVGIDKPKVVHIKQDFNLPSRFDARDNDPADPEQADREDIFNE